MTWYMKFRNFSFNNCKSIHLIWFFKNLIMRDNSWRGREAVACRIKPCWSYQFNGLVFDRVSYHHQVRTERKSVRSFYRLAIFIELQLCSFSVREPTVLFSEWEATQYSFHKFMIESDKWNIPSPYLAVAELRILFCVLAIFIQRHDMHNITSSWKFLWWKDYHELKLLAAHEHQLIIDKFGLISAISCVCSFAVQPSPNLAVCSSGILFGWN